MGATEKIFDYPLHPSPQMLMASVPRLDKKWEAAQRALSANHSGLASRLVSPTED